MEDGGWSLQAIFQLQSSILAFWFQRPAQPRFHLTAAQNPECRRLHPSPPERQGDLAKPRRKVRPGRLRAQRQRMGHPVDVVAVQDGLAQRERGQRRTGPFGHALRQPPLTPHVKRKAAHSVLPASACCQRPAGRSNTLREPGLGKMRVLPPRRMAARSSACCQRPAGRSNSLRKPGLGRMRVLPPRRRAARSALRRLRLALRAHIHQAALHLGQFQFQLPLQAHQPLPVPQQSFFEFVHRSIR